MTNEIKLPVVTIRYDPKTDKLVIQHVNGAYVETTSIQLQNWAIRQIRDSIK